MSRHDHFPRSDIARRRRLHDGELALAAELQSEDAAPGGLTALMAELAGADPDHIFAELSPWLTNHGWVSARLAALTRFAAADPFAMPPVRIFSGATLGGLILAEVPPITLSLMVRPFNQPAPRDPTVIFSPGYGLTHFVRGGGARARRFQVAISDEEQSGGFRAAHAAPCETVSDEPLHDGMAIRCDQQRESFNLSGGTGDIVMLQLFVHVPSRVPMREYQPDGRLIRVAAAGRVSSFRQMGMALLRAFGRRDAAPLLIAALADPDFSMRWQIMRELVALDTQAALPHLAAMAKDDPHPEVRAAAETTLRLVREHIAIHAPVTEPA